MKYHFHIVLLSMAALFFSCAKPTNSSDQEEEVSNKTISDQVEGQENYGYNDANKEGNTSAENDANKRMMGFNIERDLPIYAPEIQKDQEMYDLISKYGTSVTTGNGIKGDKDILKWLNIRDERLIPYFYSLTENFEENESGFIDKNYEQLSQELNLLGMDMNFSEGTFVDMGVYPVMEEWIEKHASDGLKLYTQFKVAATQANNGEYPYLNMEPRIQKVVIGEKLASLEDSTYFLKVQEEYEEAVLALADIHKVYNPNNRQEESFLVDGVSTEMYPFVTEKKTRNNFVQSQRNSKFSQLVEKILDNPSEISNKPEQIYVIVTEWLDSKKMAQRRVIGHLNKGEDVPHYLSIKRPDGTTRFAVTYRFFENEEKANQALEKIQQEIPSAKLIFCSMKGDQLYQMGPVEDI